MDKYTVKIKQIDWLDREGSEAEVCFEFDNSTFWAFSHPCTFTDEDKTRVCISLIEEDISEDAFWLENESQKREMRSLENKRCYYQCYGQVVKLEPTRVDCGALTLSIGDWLHDQNTIGSYVYFVIARLDITKCL